MHLASIRPGDRLLCAKRHIALRPVLGGPAFRSLFAFPFQGGFHGCRAPDLHNMAVLAEIPPLLRFPALQIVRNAGVNVSVALLQVAILGVARHDPCLHVIGPPYRRDAEMRQESRTASGGAYSN